MTVEQIHGHRADMNADLFGDPEVLFNLNRLVKEPAVSQIGQPADVPTVKGAGFRKALGFRYRCEGFAGS